MQAELIRELGIFQRLTINYIARDYCALLYYPIYTGARQEFAELNFSICPYKQKHYCTIVLG